MCFLNLLRIDHRYATFKSSAAATYSLLSFLGQCKNYKKAIFNC